MHSYNIQGPTTKWVFYAWINLKQNIVSFTMVWNMEFFTWYIDSQRIIFNVQEQGTEFSSRKIYKNIDDGRRYDCIFFWHACNCCFSCLIVFGLEYCTVKFKIISFVVIIRRIRNVVVGYVLVSETIIVRLFQCN